MSWLKSSLNTCSWRLVLRSRTDTPQPAPQSATARWRRGRPSLSPLRESNENKINTVPVDTIKSNVWVGNEVDFSFRINDLRPLSIVPSGRQNPGLAPGFKCRRRIRVYRRSSPPPAPRPRPAVIVIKNQIKEFYNKVKQYKLDDIICIDEISLNSFMIRRKCYEELGKRCVVKTESQKVLFSHIVWMEIYWNICYFYKRCCWVWCI